MEFLMLSIGFIAGAIWVSKDGVKPLVRIADKIVLKPKHKAYVPRKEVDDELIG